ncbi:hypothetical protein ACH4TS_23550 [Streptomyces albidoflavus]
MVRPGRRRGARQRNRDQASFDDYSGVLADIDEGKRLATAFGDKKAIILRDYGHLTAGSPSTRPLYGHIVRSQLDLLD